MRPALISTGAVVLVLLASAVVDARRAAPWPTIAQSMDAGPPHRASAHSASAERRIARPLQSAVLLQAIDCTGNLRMLHLLHRLPVRDRIQLAVLWYVGPASDTLLIRRLLPQWTSAVPLHAVPSHVRADLARMGHTSTPALVVLDQSQRVRFATQSPRSPREYAGLRRIIEGLTWIEEL
ncbi:MAG: hypothetical protein KA154_16685 [Gemmatimonadaceae bacterium]|jgi:hypothetical protein|nr:hypothetical protein [Gemmatimonadaceae bacterium]MCC6431164.1 hypothetical protein [Gemmatimonadaceae bacterium]